MDRIIIILGLLYFVDALLDKFYIYYKFEQKAMRGKSKFIYELSKCRFCMMFHLSWIITVLYGTMTNFETSLIIVPFVVSGLTRLKEKI